MSRSLTHRPRARRRAAGDERLPGLVRAIGRYIVPVYDYVLMTEPLDSQRDRSAGPRRASATRATSSTTTARPPTAASCSAAGTRSTATAARSRRATTTTSRPSPRSRSTSSTRSRSSRACASRTAGAARSTRPRSFSVFFGRALGGKLSYATGYTGLGVAAARFGGRHRARPARRPRHRGHPPALRAQEARAPSRRSRCATRSSSTPATTWRRQTATRAGVDPGSPSARSARASASIS